MSALEVLKALDSPLRLKVLELIGDEPHTLAEIVSFLMENGYKQSYRATIYRALERLVEVGLLDKIYIKCKGICYKRTSTRLILDFEKMDVILQ